MKFFLAKTTEFKVFFNSLFRGLAIVFLYQTHPFFTADITGSNLIATTPVLIAPVGVYSKKIKNLENLKEGARVAIPNDATNESRALELLEKAKLIELNKNTLKTPLDINKNPKKLKFIDLKPHNFQELMIDCYN